MIVGLPRIYVEGFEKTVRDIPLIDPSTKTFHFHMGTAYMQWIVAWYKEHGAKLIWCQHGAYYGELEYAGQINERVLANQYRTWGWE